MRLLRFSSPFLYILCAVLCAPAAKSKTRELKCARDPNATIDMPISLAAGNIVQTPEFAVKRKRYLIEIEAQKRPAPDELGCKMGFQLIPSDNDCKVEPVIEVDWKVLDGDRIVAHGHDAGKSTAFEADGCYLARIIGEFEGERKHKYVLEVTFTKDETPLNPYDPHLVVLMDTGFSM